MVVAVVVAAVVVEVAAVSAGPARAARPIVVFDSDMDFDDAAALAYLAQEHRLGRVDLRAVTVVNNGAGLPGQALRHARCLLQLLGVDGVEVAAGSDTAPNAFPTELRLSIDRVLSSVLSGCTTTGGPTPLTAPQLIRRVLAAEPRAQVIVTGPLSNVAAALPAAAGRVTSMGGAVRVPGNLCCGTPPEFDGTQEFNYWIDPPASRAVLTASGAPLRLVPLDATNEVPITGAFVDRLRADHRTPAADIVLGILSHPELAPLVAAGALFWWDPLAAMTVIRPDVVDVEVGRLDVITAGPSAGRTLLSRTGRPTSFATAADPAAFESQFLATLNGRR